MGSPPPARMRANLSSKKVSSASSRAMRLAVRRLSSPACSTPPQCAVTAWKVSDISLPQTDLPSTVGSNLVPLATLLRPSVRFLAPVAGLTSVNFQPQIFP